MLKQESELVVGASKLLLIKINDLTLSSMLAGGVLICLVMNMFYYFL